jgi:hypothetical protein
MRMIFVAPLVIAAVVSAISCRPSPPPETEVRGDVFIVTKGGQNIKLGLVQVGFIREAAIAPVIASQMEKARPKLLEIESTARDANHKAKMATIREDLMRTTVEITERTVGVAKEVGRRSYEQARKRHAEARAQYLDALKEHAQALKTYLDAERLVKLYRTGCFFAEGVPDAVARDKTDADGRFMVKLQPGRYAAIAVANRQVGKEEETYCWYVWTTVAGEPTKKLMLSNDNLAETKCADCVLPLGKLSSDAREMPVSQPDAGVAAASVGQ